LGSLASFGDNLFGSGNRLLGFLLLHTSGGGPGFFDQFAGLRVGFFQDLTLQAFSPRKFGFNFFRISQALGDALAALGEHGQDRSVSKTVEEKSDDAKTDDLSEKMR